jgi:ankyrin repeat protein
MTAAKSTEQKLIEAVAARDYDTVRALIALKPDLDYIGQAPTHDPALVTQTPTGTGGFLIDDANFNTPGYRVSGKTPLYIAVSNDDLKMASLLLEAGANPDKPIDGGLHPLTIAAETALHDGITELLLRKGANPNVRSPYGDATPLAVRAGIGHQFALIALMLEKGADPALRDSQGRTALDRARERLEGGGIGGYILHSPLRAFFHAVAAPKDFFVDSARDYYETKRTVKLLAKAMRPKP